MPAPASQRARLAQLIAQDAEPPEGVSGRLEVKAPEEKFEVDDLQELRIAMVMTGGVSLAIWMGGATREFDRVIHAADEGSETYLELLRFTRSLPRVDVIAGTSAGGLNGALFAYAITQGTRVGGLGRLWTEVGALEELLRQPNQANPPSLMRGDDYFLPKISNAIKALEGRGTRPQEVPMELLITTTLLKPWPRGVSDSFGTIIHDVDHHGEFSFRRGVSLSQDNSSHDDEFDVPNIRDRLALAARCTASFPLAFEASYVPMDDDDAKAAGRPNMHDTANFSESRFVIDGGVLLNHPLRPALRAIFRQPASQQVRRVVAYVVPDPGAGGELDADAPQDMPKLADVTVASFSGIPRNQSVSAELDEITRHNARVDAQRRQRELAVVDLDPDHLAHKTYVQYRGFRADQLAGWLLAMLARGFTALELKDVQRKREARIVPEAPLRERTQLRERLIEHLAGLPPDDWPTTGADTAQWFTTVDTVERAASVVLDLLRRGLAVTDPRAPDVAGRRAALRGLRADVCAALAQAQATRQPLRRTRERELAQEAVQALREDAKKVKKDRTALDAWAVKTLPLALGDPELLRPIVEAIADKLVPAAKLVLTACDAAPEHLRERANQTRCYAHALVRGIGSDDPPGRSVTPLRRLLALEVVQLALGGRPILDQRVDLIQISGDAGNGLDLREQADEKLAGLQVAHFGAFYKCSWRANDWMWGRHDAAQRLAQVLLEPARLRQLGYTVDEAIARVRAIAFENLKYPADEPALRSAGPRVWDEERARDELSFLADDSETPPATIPMCAQAVARRLQLDILRDELPRVREAMAVDKQDGAEIRKAAAFCRAYDKAAKPLTAEDAVSLFNLCRVGDEKLAAESGSDLLARTATRTVAVGTSAFSGSRSGLPKVMRRPLKSLHGLGLMVYFVVRYGLSGSRTGAIIATAGLAAGAALVGVGLVVSIPGVLMVGGLGAMFTAVALARWRRGWPFTLFAGAAAVFVAGLPHIFGPPLLDVIDDNAVERAEPVSVVVGLLIGAFILGSISFSWMKKPRRRWRRKKRKKPKTSRA